MGDMPPIPEFLLVSNRRPLTARQRERVETLQRSYVPPGARSYTETERLYRASIEAERAAKKADGLAKLAQWKQDNPELVEAQKQVAKLKRKRNGRRTSTRRATPSA